MKTDPETSSAISVLEARFGHVLTRLIPCWGDPSCFHRVFEDLIYDSRGDRSGWPFDAFMELEFLRQIHDAAYGTETGRHDVWDDVSERD